MDKVKLKDVLTDKIGYFCKLHTGNFNICDCTDKECFEILISEITTLIIKWLESKKVRIILDCWENIERDKTRNQLITELVKEIR